MGRGAASTRLDRLERLQGLLKADQHRTVGELAAALGVSARSIGRDLALLRDGGLPIEADRGRGGGVRLAQRWRLGRIQLDPEEAIDALLSLAIAETIDSPLLLQRAAAVRQKLAMVFSEAQQARIRSLRSRILIGEPASERVRRGYRRTAAVDLAVVKRAFFEMRCLSIAYADEAGRRTAREIEPQFLYLSLPAWYVVAWDGLRGGVRSFRVDRIRDAALLDRAFRLRDRWPFLAAAEATARLL